MHGLTTEEWMMKHLSRAIWTANGGYCVIEMMFLPWEHDLYWELDQDAYDEIMSEKES
jgi:hypothetical protein